MSLTIQTNVASLQAQKNLVGNQKALMSSFNRLSSGLRVNTASDDAAGLAISESMKSQIRSFTVAERNAADGISMAQTAEGALGEVHGVLGRLRELAMQSANGSLSDTDRGYLDTEFTQLTSEITRIQDSAKFNGVTLIGVTSSGLTFQVGLNNATADQIQMTFGSLDLSSVVSAGVSSATAALAALSTIDAAIGSVSSKRASFGAAMNKMEVATSNIQTMRLNLAAANSRIVDVDVAQETSTMSRNQVLTQAGVSILAQANQLPQMAFGLLSH
ncbi:MAG TPA: flagellin [Polyangiaceae bacterium]|jgi:flagellin|nr:flagellin [Polyangiaceae bacterium]